MDTSDYWCLCHRKRFVPRKTNKILNRSQLWLLFSEGIWSAKHTMNYTYFVLNIAMFLSAVAMWYFLMFAVMTFQIPQAKYSSVCSHKSHYYTNYNKYYISVQTDDNIVYSKHTLWGFTVCASLPTDFDCKCFIICLGEKKPW